MKAAKKIIAVENEPSLKFDFQKSLKKAHSYPIINRIRVERYFTRPLASLIVRAIYNTSITPNQLTYISFILGICGALLFCGGKYLYFIIAGILAQLSSIFDCADGMLARSKNLHSDYGAFLDIFLDRITDFLLFSGIVVGYYRYSEDLALFIIGLFGVTLYFLQVTLYYILMAYKKSYKTGLAAEARSLSYFVILVCSLLNRLNFLIYVLLAVTVSYIVLKSINFMRPSKNQSRETKS